MQGETEKIGRVLLTKVILVEIARGNGTPESPVRRVNRVYDIDGSFIGEHDPSALRDFSLADQMTVAALNWCRVNKATIVAPFGRIGHNDGFNWLVYGIEGLIGVVGGGPSLADAVSDLQDKLAVANAQK